LKQALVLGTAEPRTLLWRNNTGMGWQGQRLSRAPGAMVRIEQGMVVLRDARPISFGLEGSGDIIGVCAGVPISGEAKRPTGGQQGPQLAFQRAWEAAGGRYILFRSPEEFLEGLRREL
jgi:hypothetical protein